MKNTLGQAILLILGIALTFCYTGCMKQPKMTIGTDDGVVWWIKDENNQRIYEFGRNQSKSIPTPSIPFYNWFTSKSKEQVQSQLPISENEGIEKAKKELEKELAIIRKEKNNEKREH